MTMRSNIIKSALIAAFTLVLGSLVSCQKNYGEPDPFLSVPSGVVTVDYSGRNASGIFPGIEIGSNRAWKITGYPDWAVPDVTSGERGRVTVFITCSENSTGADREGKIVISSEAGEKSVTIHQSYKVEVLEISADVFALTGAGYLDNGAKASFYILDVNSDWNITSDSGWLKSSETKGSAGQYIKIEITADENLSVEGARTGILTVKAGNIAKAITVTQSKDGLEISVAQVNVSKYGVKDDGSAISFVVSSSSAWTASAPSWITVNPASGNEGDVTVTVKVAPNTTGAQQTGTVTIASVRGDNKADFTVIQSSTPFEDNDLLFVDDFSWLKPMIDAYNELNPNKPIADSVKENNASGNAPNIYGTAGLKEMFPELIAAQGYVDLRYVPGEYECLYLQDSYLKMGKTNYHTGLQLPALDLESGEKADIVLSFDWCAHMTGGGNIDNVTITVEIEGEGTVQGTSDPSGKTCDPIASDQEKKQLKWMTPSVTLTGLTKDSKIKIRPTQMMLAVGEKPDQQRWHIDNIRIVRKK